MATARRQVAQRRTARRQSNLSSVIRGYQGRATQLLEMPVTRFILGGVALTVAVPFILRMLRNEDVTTFVRDNVDNIRTRIDGYIHSSDSDLETLNQ